MKKSKKFHDLTQKQKRKDRSVKRDSPPAYYRKMFNDELNAKAKQVLIKILNGKEIEFPIFVKNVRWWYF
jgi:hypothetical protein